MLDKILTLTYFNMYDCVQGAGRESEGKPLLSPTLCSVNADNDNDNEDALSEELSPEQ